MRLYSTLVWSSKLLFFKGVFFPPVSNGLPGSPAAPPTTSSQRTHCRYLHIHTTISLHQIMLHQYITQLFVLSICRVMCLERGLMGVLKLRVYLRPYQVNTNSTPPIFSTLYIFNNIFLITPVLLNIFACFHPIFSYTTLRTEKLVQPRHFPIFESFYIFTKQSGPMFAHVIPLNVCFLYLDLVRYLPTSSCTLLPPTSSITGALSDSPH